MYAPGRRIYRQAGGDCQLLRWVEIQILLKDSTGQSRLVDEYLGPPGGPERKRAAAAFRKMQSSLNCCWSATDLDNLFA